MTFCYNCDVSTAQFKCTQCPENESLFCMECRLLHCKIKAFKSHQFAEIPKKSIICKNCESSEARFICKECGEDEKYLCVGCSVIHPKIRAFRNHTIMPIAGIPVGNISSRTPFTFSSAGISDAFVYLIDTAYYNVSNRSLTDLVLWQTIGLCLAATVIYYTIVNTIFRKYAPLVNIAMAIWLYQWLQSNKFKVSDEDKAKVDVRKKVSPSLAGLSQKLNGMGGIFGSASGPRVPASWNEELNPDDFKGEFWYSTESKKSSLRPRTRPYRGRRPGASNGGADEQLPSPSKE